MKKGLYVLTVLLLFTGLTADAQRRHIRKAENAFEDKDYQEVIERLNKAKDKGAVLSNALLEIKAVSHYKLNDKEKAITLFSELDRANVSGSALVQYGKLLREETRYSDAVGVFNQAIEKGENSAEVKYLKKASEWAADNNFYMDGFDITEISLAIKGASAGVQFYKDGMIFSKSEEKEKARRREKDFTYSDIYFVPFKNGSFGKEKVFSNELKFPFSAGATDFTADEEHMYFTKVVKGKNGEVAKIFRADYGKDEWHEDVKELPFNSKSYSCAMPALGADGSYMVFSSNMPGSKGSFDLFIVFREGKNKWSKPRNLGSSINTKGTETFPFIDENDVLYYSSDHLMGFGGLDIFKATRDGDAFGEPKNMMIPLNSGRDDFAFTINPDNPREAFMVSNRKGNGAYDKIFRVKLPRKQEETTSTSDDDFLTEADGGTDELDDFLESTGEEEESQPSSSNNQNTEDESSSSEGDELDQFLDEATAQSEQESDESGEATSLEDAMKEAASGGENLVYRVQFFSSIKPLDRLNKFEPTGDYVYRYYYKGLYRYTIGEFYTPEPAIELKKKVQKLGYEDAFVAVFRDKERVLDVQVYDNENEDNKEKQKQNNN